MHPANAAFDNPLSNAAFDFPAQKTLDVLPVLEILLL